MFDDSQDFATIDFRQRSDLYLIGRGKQGVPLTGKKHRAPRLLALALRSTIFKGLCERNIVI